MKVMVALQNRFYEAPSGNIYSNNVCDYSFWQRYLQVFDEVVIFARVGFTDTEPDKPTANGPGVSFYRLPMYLGPWQYIRQRKRLAKVAAEAPDHADVFIIRAPSLLGTLLLKNLRKRDIPFGVEVVGDPWDSLAPGSVKSVVRPFVRLRGRIRLGWHCREAAAASYVTENSLQKRYPPGGWSTHYSSIDLPSEAIADDSEIKKRLATLEKKWTDQKSWRICYAGTMSQLYKAPDILIAAVADCLTHQLKLELVMLGDGQYRPKLEDLAKNLGISSSVNFIGALPSGQAVYKQLDQADLYVLPSRQEGLPRSVIEAMARGLPCIGSTVGGFNELLPEEFLVQPGDHTMLSQKIQEILSSPGKMKQAVIRNVAVAQKYTSDVLNKRRIEFYERVKNISQSSKKALQV